MLLVTCLVSATILTQVMINTLSRMTSVRLEAKRWGQKHLLEKGSWETPQGEWQWLWEEKGGRGNKWVKFNPQTSLTARDELVHMW